MARDSDQSTGTPLGVLFAQCSPDQKAEYRPEKRSLRIRGHSTTIRLERAFWTLLEEMADGEGIAVADLITRIHDHCLDTDRENLTSCLRVVCIKYINIGG